MKDCINHKSDAPASPNMGSMYRDYLPSLLLFLISSHARAIFVQGVAVHLARRKENKQTKKTYTTISVCKTFAVFRSFTHGLRL